LTIYPVFPSLNIDNHYKINKNKEDFFMHKSRICNIFTSLVIATLFSEVTFFNEENTKEIIL